jgi:hypothetical protein
MLFELAGRKAYRSAYSAENDSICRLGCSERLIRERVVMHVDGALLVLTPVILPSEIFHSLRRRGGPGT